MVRWNITRGWGGNGPKNRTPNGFNRISSKLSRKPVAQKSANNRATRDWFFFHWRQYSQRPRDTKGKDKSLAKYGSTRGATLPPGQQRSPGCLTLSDRLFKMMHGCAGPLLLQDLWLNSNKTPAAANGSTASDEYIGARSDRSWSTWIMWLIRADLSIKSFTISCRARFWARGSKVTTDGYCWQLSLILPNLSRPDSVFRFPIPNSARRAQPQTAQSGLVFVSSYFGIDQVDTSLNVLSFSSSSGLTITCLIL